MTLLDSTGAPIPSTELPSRFETESESRCPKCGKKALDTIEAMGGHWSRTCTQCGHDVATGRN